jgi:protein SMG6
MIHNLLRLTLAHNVPVSLRAVPEKYNLIMRLWLNGFHRPLENLRRCAFNNSIVALEHLQDFIYYAYTFYSCLFEEENLAVYRSSWVESLGDLARYRMAVSELVTSKTSHSASLTHSAVSQVASISDDVAMSITADDTKASQISDNPVLPKGNSPSVGIEAARAMELLPEREKWRNIARGWYSNGLTEYPGTGKLHHHMGFLCKEFGKGEELRGLYHFIKRYTSDSPGPISQAYIFPQHDNTSALHNCPRVRPRALVTICTAASFLPRSSRVRPLHPPPWNALYQHPT